MTRWARRALAIVLFASCARSLPAQRPPSPQLQPLARVDVIAARQTALQAALGVAIPLGTYVRIDAVAGGGATTGAGTTGAGGRADVIARFLLDPLGEHRFGPYAGGGASVRYDPVTHWRPFIALVAGVDGPARGEALVPFAEVGYGGGVRLGIGMRHHTAPFR